MINYRNFDRLKTEGELVSHEAPHCILCHVCWVHPGLQNARESIESSDSNNFTLQISGLTVIQ